MKIIICGSMTASKEMLKLEDQLKTLGFEVELPSFTHEYAQMSSINDIHGESVKNKLTHDLIRGYFEKIKESDAVLVANIERKGIAGYVGGNSFLEMSFAHVLNKPLYLLNPIPEMSYVDEMKAMRPVILNGNLSLISK
jgi:hypothetical protein